MSIIFSAFRTPETPSLTEVLPGEEAIGLAEFKMGGQAAYPLQSRIRGAVNSAVMGGPSSGYPAAPYGMMMPAGEVTYSGTQRYLPTMPQISSVQRSTQPCLFEHRIQKGPGFWKWKCARTTQPGVKKCNLVRVEKDQSRLVPINCAQDVVNVLKGYDVNRTTTTLPSGQKITQQFVTPEVAVIGNVRKLGPDGAFPFDCRRNKKPISMP